MKNEIRLNEAQLNEIITESVRKHLNEMDEISADFYKKYADKANDVVGGLKGKFMGKDKRDKIKRQAELFADMHRDHPEDEWERVPGSYRYNGMGTSEKFRNSRTGEEREHSYWDTDVYEPLPFRGRSKGKEDTPKKDNWHSDEVEKGRKETWKRYIADKKKSGESGWWNSVEDLDDLDNLAENSQNELTNIITESVMKVVGDILNGKK